jgi:ArsR family transcriptional regulator, arsenate/arsenite/antimonite-responsive transcriptional repressor
MVETIDFGKIEQACDILHKCQHKKRREIINVVLKNPGIIASDIDKKIKLDQPTTSGHLSILRKAGVLKTNHHGKHVHYTVNMQALRKIETLSISIVETIREGSGLVRRSSDMIV